VEYDGRVVSTVKDVEMKSQIFGFVSKANSIFVIEEAPELDFEHCVVVQTKCRVFIRIERHERTGLDVRSVIDGFCVSCESNNIAAVCVELVLVVHGATLVKPRLLRGTSYSKASDDLPTRELSERPATFRLLDAIIRYARVVFFVTDSAVTHQEQEKKFDKHRSTL
jgi:hypothetical protein